jgi:dienelactone hydrolase
VVALFADIACSSERAGPQPRVRDVEIRATGLTLKGTLQLPRGEGPFPAVLFGNGSGPQTRDEVLDGQLNMKFGCEVALFRELAEALAERGYASLRYDKRACGPFNGCAENGYPAPEGDGSVDLELDDAHAAFAALAERPEVDRSRLFYVGHSQGASFAPRLMRDDPSRKAAVLLAGPHDPVDRLLALQLDESRQLLERIGRPPPTSRRRSARSRRWLPTSRHSARARSRVR